MESFRNKSAHAAIEEVYLKYYDRLLKYGITLKIKEDEVRDLINDIFMWFLQDTDRLKRINHLDTYLFSALRKNAASVLNVKQRRQSINSYQQSYEHSPSPEDLFLMQETESVKVFWLKSQIEKLSAHQQEVLFLRFFENLPYSKISDIMSVSEQVVRNSVYRAVKKLRVNAKENAKGLQKIFYFFFF